MRFNDLIKTVSAKSYTNVEGVDALTLAREILSCSESVTDEQIDILLNGLNISKDIDAECSKAGGMDSMYDSAVLKYALNYTINGIQGFEVGFKYLEVNGKKFGEKMKFNQLMKHGNHVIYYSKKYRAFFCPEVNRYDLKKDGITGGGYSSLVFLHYETGRDFMYSMLNDPEQIIYVKDVNLIDNGLGGKSYDELYHILGYKIISEL